MIKFSYTTVFNKNIKQLGKKYPPLVDDLLALANSLSENPDQGMQLADNYRKIRMSIKSKGKGKRGGARVITFNCLVAKNDGEITFVTIYDKSDIENISLEEIKKVHNIS